MLNQWKISFDTLTLTDGALELSDNVLSDPIMKKMTSDPSTKFDIVIVSPFLAAEAGYYLAHRYM